MIRVVLAENHHVVRQGLKTLLNHEDDIEVIAEAADGRQAVEAVEKMAPEILVLDWMLPQISGLEVCRRLQTMDLPTKVLILSMHADEGYVLQALKHGASGYVLKDASGTELINAIRTCHRGERFLSPPFSEERLLQYSEKMDTGKLDPYQGLTDREREVLQMVAEGQTSGEIAEKLSISSRTVESHRTNLMRKLALKSTYEVTRYALRKGIISVD